MLNLLNIANSDATFDGEGISIDIDNTTNTAFSFNNLLSLGDKSQSNNTDIGIFDSFLNSDNILEIDLKHLSQIIDKNPIASLNIKLELISKLNSLKVKFLDDGLIDNIKNKLNNIKAIVNNNDKKQVLSNEFKERILFTSNDKDNTKQNNINNKDFSKDSNKITINSIQDIEKISDKYDLNISKIKIETYEHKNPKAHTNTQLDTNINTSKIFNTSDVVLLKKIKNKSIESPSNTIKDIFTSFNKSNIGVENNEVKILPTSVKTYPIKEVEKINRLSFSHKTKLEDFKDSKYFKNIQSLNNTSFKNDDKNVEKLINNNIIKNSNASNIKQILSNDTKKPIVSTINPTVDDDIINIKKENESLVLKTSIKPIINNNNKIDNSNIKDKPLKTIKDDKKYSLKDVLSSVSKKDIISDIKKVNTDSIISTKALDKPIQELTKAKIIQEKPIKTPIIGDKIDRILTQENKTKILSVQEVENVTEKVSTKDKILPIQEAKEVTKKTLIQDKILSVQEVENVTEKEVIKDKILPIQEAKEVTKKTLIQDKILSVQEVENVTEKVLVQEKETIIPTQKIDEKTKKTSAQKITIPTQEVQEKTTSFYKYDSIETININNDKQTTLKDIFDLKDTIITKQKHILDDVSQEKEKHIITSKEVVKSVSQKPQLISSTLPITSKTKHTNTINAKLDNKINKTKLLNSLMDNAINRMAITNEIQDDKKIKTLIQELSHMPQEPLKDKQDIENKSIKIQIEPLVLNEKDLNTNNEYNQKQESTTEHKSTIIDVSKFADTNQSKELNQIMQRQIINGVYENLRYKLSNFVAPLMKFALELKPANLGKIDIDIMVRGNNLQVNIKSNKKVSSLLESEVAELKNEFSVLGYTKITIDFDGSEDSGFSNNKPKENSYSNTTKDTRWL